jgi:hypothetical protein
LNQQQRRIKGSLAYYEPFTKARKVIVVAEEMINQHMIDPRYL